MRIFNERRSCLAGAVISGEGLPEVVQLSTGAWYDPADPDDPHSQEMHGKPNVLTLDIGTSSLAQGPVAQNALVDVERYEGPIPKLGSLG